MEAFVSRLRPDKLHTTFDPAVSTDGPLVPRRYTLTHSDSTGELFLSIGEEYDENATSGWYTRLMRDEVLAEWLMNGSEPELHIHCHVSGGVTFGPAKWRDLIFQQELPLVLEALRYGDQRLYEANPHLDEAPILIHFHARQARYHRVESWGNPADYHIKQVK
jgi:hypothetical protein